MYQRKWLSYRCVILDRECIPLHCLIEIYIIELRYELMMWGFRLTLPCHIKISLNMFSSNVMFRQSNYMFTTHVKFLGKQKCEHLYPYTYMCYPSLWDVGRIPSTYMWVFEQFEQRVLKSVFSVHGQYRITNTRLIEKSETNKAHIVLPQLNWAGHMRCMRDIRVAKQIRRAFDWQTKTGG